MTKRQELLCCAAGAVLIVAAGKIRTMAAEVRQEDEEFKRQQQAKAREKLRVSLSPDVCTKCYEVPANGKEVFTTIELASGRRYRVTVLGAIGCTGYWRTVYHPEVF